MTDTADRRRRLGSALRLAVLAIALTALVVIVGSALGDRTVPKPSASTPKPSAGPWTASPSLDADVRCTREPGTTASNILNTDPCPGAILAVQLAVAPVRLPTERMVIEPGPFYCNEIWPGVGTPRVCSMFAIRPGQFMHAWVSFRGSDEVAVVMLGLDFPENPNAPGATRPPWDATLFAVAVPPAGWVMP